MTEGLGARLARAALARPRRRACVIALIGNLGAGKTTFVRGFLRACGVRRGIASPTFVLMKKFPLRASLPGASRGGIRGAGAVYHLDCYRLRGSRELRALGFRDICADPTALILVEWAERVARALPRDAWRVRFFHGRASHERRLTFPYASLAR